MVGGRCLPPGGLGAWSFGRNWQNVVASNNPLKYCGSLGHRSEGNTGLIYMRARYYDPATGRFEFEDPAKDGANWSLYAHGDPVNGSDYTGCVAGIDDWLNEEAEDGKRCASAYANAKGQIANFAKAKWYNTDKLKNVLSGKRYSFDQEQIYNIIHGAKGQGLGPADNIGLDHVGGMWTKTGDFLGFVWDFI